MAIQSPTVLKSYFPSNSYSTEVEFRDLIDSCTNTLITGDMTVDSNNVARINPSIISNTQFYSTSITRLGSTSSNTITISTPFLPKIVFATMVLSLAPSQSSTSFGRSNGIDNNCMYTKVNHYTVGMSSYTISTPVISNSYSIAFKTTTSPSLIGVINNFTANSFDIVFTKVGSLSLNFTIDIDVLG